MCKTLTAALAALAIGLIASSAAAGTLPAKAILQADKPGAVISRNLYGQFSEHLGGGVYDGIWVGEGSAIANVRGIRSDVVAALKALKTPLVRWPGGCFADEYHWRDGIGPRGERPLRKNNWWGGAPESNAFGTHEFMDFIEQIGAEAYVSVNVGSSTPTEMREWIEYMTSPGQDTLAQERRKNGRDQPWKVALWGIGNENWGCGGNMTAEYYANELRRFISFFHQGEDNPGLRVATGPSGDDTRWTDVLMKNAGHAFDALSLHYYTLPTGNWKSKGAATGFSRKEWVDTFAQTLKMDDYIKRHSAIMDSHDPDKRVGLYVDEWGTWYDVEPGTNPGYLYQQNTLRDAVVAAANLNIFHQHADRVRMSAIAQTINVLQAMILTDGAELALTPTYHAFRMYVPFQDATSLPLQLTTPEFTLDGTSIPAINASAARGKDGKIHIAIANMDPQDSVDLSIDLSGLKAKSVTGEVLTADKMDAHNVPGQPAAIAPKPYTGGRLGNGKLMLDLPAKSVVVVTLD
jgi:alpha-N-arabinofuranosidase